MTTAPASTLDYASPAQTAKPAAGQGRLVSLDALRGFDMFWIVGADALVAGISQLASDNRAVKVVEQQLRHKSWEGLAFEDLIFPLFVFIVGVSLVFSLTKALQRGGRGAALRRVVLRAAVLYFLGLMVYGGFSRTIHDVRWLGVLQRIAICYLVASLLFCFLSTRAMAGVIVGLLVVYWLVMAFVPTPGVGRGSFAERKNLANWVDAHALPGHKWDGDHDPEGILSTFPAIGTCLLGVMAGLLMRSTRVKPYAKVGILIGGGLALVGIGYAWGFVHSPVQFPVIKKLWTSSYVLLAGGYSALILALFYLVIDIWGARWLAAPFVWIGTNAILIYMITELGMLDKPTRYLVGGFVPKLGHFGLLTLALVQFALLFALARFLYRRGVFIRA